MTTPNQVHGISYTTSRIGEPLTRKPVSERTVAGLRDNRLSVPNTKSEKPVEGPQLTSDEDFFITNALLLTGRDDRLERGPIVLSNQLPGIKAVVPILKNSTSLGLGEAGKCDIFNRLLLALAIKPAKLDFFKVVFGGVNLSNENDVEERVTKFRILCMLEYGSFRFGYKLLKSGSDNIRGVPLSTMWAWYFPSDTEIERRIADFKRKPGPAGLSDILPTQLFVLGYLSSEQAKEVNNAREKLSKILDTAIVRGVNSPDALYALARQSDAESIGELVAKAGLPDTERFLYPSFYAPGEAYKHLLEEAREACNVVNEEDMQEAFRLGTQNTETWLAMHDVDVYVATSMREPLHFTTNHAFVTELFKQGELSSWKIRYFDPTQSYLPDRIQKGLIECLMIKRAEVVIYNAQETDTFGKDAEAATALAQGKPVIVFVARLFGHDARFEELYQSIDSAPRLSKDELIALMFAKKYITQLEVNMLSAADKSKLDCIETVLDRKGAEIVNSMPANELEAELLTHGYKPPKPSELSPFATERIQKLERRALTFQDFHPLSLLASPMDGVARGVIVTRSTLNTAKVLKGLLIGSLAYDIVSQERNWALVERITNSTVRVVAKNPVLTTAFWSEFTWERALEKSEKRYGQFTVRTYTPEQDT